MRLPMENYSIGHELILQSERNPLAVLDGAQFDQLSTNEKCFAIIRASLVCSRPYSENHLPHRWLKLWHWMISREDIFKSIKTFQEYRIQGSTYPKPPDKEAEQIANAGNNDDSGRQLGGDLMPRLVSYLCGVNRQLGYETVYDIPFGFALHLYFTQLEMEGRMKIENDRERQVRREIDQCMAEIQKDKESLSPA